MVLRASIFALMVCVGPVIAQDRAQTLADIRQELSVLFVELQKLKTELNTSGSAGQTVGGTVLDRVTTIESELQRLTANTEALQFRVDRIVQDGTNQIGDLEFRLCELEEGCDIGALGDTPTLGGGTTPAVAPAPTPQTETDPGPQLAVGEEADFARAQEALANGDFRSAAEQFAAFNQAYPGSPLAAAADLARGEALDRDGDTREAARAYLAAFSADQQSRTAPVALFKLGEALGKLGQTNEACVTLGEVGARYPGDDTVLLANSAMRNIGCP